MPTKKGPGSGNDKVVITSDDFKKMAEPVLSTNGISLTFADGLHGYFNYFWLRDNCASAIDPETHERVYEIRNAPDDLHANKAWIDAGALHIVWANDGHNSRYDLEWLSNWARNPGRNDTAQLARRYWFGDHFPRIQRFSQSAVLASDTVLADWIEALLVEGIAIVTDMPNTNAGLEDLAARVGIVRPCIDGDYLDIRTHIDGQSLSFTSGALEIHTDLPAEELPPGIQFLHCRANDSTGGESLFVDGGAVTEDFRHERPEDFELLAGTDIPFFYEHKTYDLRARQKVIELDPMGAVSGITVSGHMLDMLDMDQRFLDKYYPALRRFHQALNEPKYCMRFHMKAAECLVFDNHRIAHGRSAYDAESGYRYLRLCYIDRGEMRSTYRALKKRNSIIQAAE